MSTASFFTRLVRSSVRNSLRRVIWRRRHEQHGRRELSLSRWHIPHAVDLLEDRTLLASFTVNITDDTVDANPGDGDALDAAGNTSLRAAIMEANALVGADTIDLPAGTYALTIANTAGQENFGAEGDLDIDGDLTIIGGTANPENTRVSGSGLGGFDRVFHVMNGASVEFHNLGVVDGSAVDNGFAGNLPGMHGHGGGVLVVEGSTVTFDNVDIENNVSSWSGGGIYNEFSTVDITNDTVVAGNRAIAGGGIYAFGTDDRGDTTNVIDSTVQGNFAIAPDANADALGGGIYNDGDVINITNSQIIDNQAIGFGATGSNTTSELAGVGGTNARGGGIYMGFASGEVHITDASVVGGNSAIGGQGFAGTAGDDGTTGGSSSGESGDGGGDGGNAYGGGLYANFGLVDVRDATFSGNSAIGGDGGQGGDGGETPFNGTGGAGGDGGEGGEGEGGGIGIGVGGFVSVEIDNSLFGMNTATGGAGGLGGNGGDAGSAEGTTFGFPTGTGGTGGAGGNGGNGGATSGGAIYTNSGTLDITNTTFTNANTATGGIGGDGGAGGIAFVEGGEGGNGGDGGNAGGGGVGIGLPIGGPPFVTIGLSEFLGNRAFSGAGGAGGRGGDGGSLTDTSASSPIGTGTAGNGGGGGRAGDAVGGGLFADSGTIDVTDSTFDQHLAVAGEGGAGGAGGDSFEYGGIGGDGGEGGEAAGGGIGAVQFGQIPDLEVQRSTLFGNQAIGGVGGRGGDGGAGTTSESSEGAGGNGGFGGEAAGGGLFVEGVLLSLINTTVSANSATSGDGGNGGDAEESPADPGIGGEGASVGGGGVDVDAALSGSAINDSTITLNNNLVGADGVDGAGGENGAPALLQAIEFSATGLAVFSTGLTINNTIVAQNFGDHDLYSDLPLAGEGNFIGNGDGATGIADGVDGNDVGTTQSPLDAQLDPIGFNGGPTRTHHPGTGSPVINDGVDGAVPAEAITDQRGFERFMSTVDVGAVEVHFDWGDAPDPSYATLLVSDGPRHALGSGLFLGASVDSEQDGQPNATATGDDMDLVFTNPGDTPFPPGDEDGVIAATAFVAGQSASVTIVASLAGSLDGWIDVNGNGTFDHPAEHLDGGVSIPVVPGPNVLSFTLPANSVPGISYARLRISSAGSLLPTGFADDGEVEDYEVEILTTGSIHGFKYEDIDADGVYNDLVDVPLFGVEFTLTGTDVLGNPVNQPGFTNVDGEFGFEDLVPGDYTVTETVPAGHVATTPTTYLSVVNSGEELVAFDGQAMPDDPQFEVLIGAPLMFGNTVPGSIHGFKFEDVDNDGVYNDAIDLPLAGVDFTLTGTDGQGNVINTTETTDINGEFWFTGLLASVDGGVGPATGYTVTETVPAGFVATTPTSFDTDLLSRQELVALPGQAMLPAPVSTTINFDNVDASGGPISGAALDSYLNSQYGITVTDISPGGLAEIVDDRFGFPANVLRAFSDFNVFWHDSPNDPYSYTVNFAVPQSTFGFTRPVLFGATPSGLTWRARATDASGALLDTVGEPQLAFFSSIPAQPFTLNGPGIASVIFDRTTINTIAGLNRVPTDNWIVDVPTDPRREVVVGTNLMFGNHRTDDPPEPGPLSLSADMIFEDESVSLTGSYSDQNLGDSHTVEVDWDDPNDPVASTFAIPAINTLTVGDTFSSTTDDAVFEVTSLDLQTGEVGFEVTDHQYLDDGPAPGNGTAQDISFVSATFTDSGGLTSAPYLDEFITNGDFETGDFTDWTITNTGNGGWAINDGTFDPDGPALPLAPISGNFDAVTFQGGPGVHILTEPIVVPANVSLANLSWSDRIQNFGGGFSDPTQEWRVQVLDGGGGLIQEVYSTNVGDPDQQLGPNNRSFDLTSLLQSLAGQTVQINFEEQDSFGFFNVTLDNVSLQINSAPGVTVKNVAPRQVQQSGLAMTNENEAYTLSGSFNDPGLLDEHDLRVDWDDPNNANDSTFELPATSSLSISDVFNSTTDDAVLTITNIVGGTVSYDVSHQYLDDGIAPGNGTAVDVADIRVYIDDDDLGSGLGALFFDVKDVAPTLTLDAVTMINENGVATLTGTIADPGTLDAFTLDLNWGDPLSPDNTETYSFGASPTGSQTFTITHQYLDDNPGGTSQDIYTISGTVTDDDTLAGSDTTTVLVKNVAPVITSLDTDASSLLEKSADRTVELTGALTDIGTLDEHTVIVQWGDGSTSDSSLNPGNFSTLDVDGGGTGSFAATHTYATSGIYEIIVTVIDDDTGESTTQTTPAVLQGVGLLGDTLYIIGTDFDDVVDLHFNPYSDELTVDVTLDDDGAETRIQEAYPIPSVSRIVTFLCDGDDEYEGGTFTASFVPQLVFGGGGNDDIDGGRGTDALFGGPGNDELEGYRGNDILAGGDDIDEIEAGDGDDLLIGGIVDNDFTDVAIIDEIDAAIAAWAAGDKDGTFNELGPILDDGDVDDLLGQNGVDSFAGIGILVEETNDSTVVSERGNRDTVSVRLLGVPDADVTVDIFSDDTSEVAVDTPRLTFTAANWNTPQAVFLRGVDDAVLDGTTTTVVRFVMDPNADFPDEFDAVSDSLVEVQNLDYEQQIVLTGTPGDDTFSFTPGTPHVIRLNGTNYEFRGTAPVVTFNGAGGRDTVTLRGDGSDDTATLAPTSAGITSSRYEVTTTNTEVHRLYLDGGSNTVEIHDSPGDDVIILKPQHSWMTTAAGGYGFVTGYYMATAQASGGYDQAQQYDSAGNEQLMHRPGSSSMIGSGFELHAVGFETVRGFASLGMDTVVYYDSLGDDTFVAKPEHAYMQSPGGLYRYSQGFDMTTAYSNAGGFDRGQIYDSIGNDLLVSRFNQTYLVTGGVIVNQLRNFEETKSFSTRGGIDDAQFYDTTGSDRFIAKPTYSYLFNRSGSFNYLNYQSGFDRVLAVSNKGGTDLLDQYAGLDYFFEKIGDWVVRGF